MGDTKNKVPGWTTLYLSLYDVLGYVAPGFVLIGGLLLIGGWHGCCGYELDVTALGNIVKSFGLYVITGGIVACYLTGHFLAALSKIPERLGWFGLGRIPECLFADRGEKRPYYRREVTLEVLERFARAYYFAFLTEREPEAKYPYVGVIRELVGEGELRYKGILWDCYDYLLSHDQAQHYAVYTYLSLQGLFRSVTAAGIILSAFTFAVADYGNFSRLDVVWLAVPVLITLFSASRYVKFARQFYSQTLRSFAVVFGE